MLEAYRRHQAERAALGVPPLPLRPAQVGELCRLLENPPPDEAEALLRLLADRVPPGVDPAAEVKAHWLGELVAGRVRSPVLDRRQALRLAGTMLGGYNLPVLISALGQDLAAEAAEALQGLTLIGDAFPEITALADAGNTHARAVLHGWAEATWFTRRPPLPDAISAVVYRVSGETNTDDLSPATAASTRPDIPLHAQVMYANRDPACRRTLARLRASGRKAVMVGDVYGTGSSRKSAVNSLFWWIGDDIPHVPNKRRGGIVLARIIAPIFANTVRDAGGLALATEVGELATGDEIEIRPRDGLLLKAGHEVARFRLEPASLADEFCAGGRTTLILGRNLTAAARRHCGLEPTIVFAAAPVAPASLGRGYTLAQKLVGRACGRPGVRPGESVEPRISTVGSQDTTGPMTADELKELACRRFAADLVMQSFCHTAAYPKAVDVAMHQWLPRFIAERGGVTLRPGDGIIHSWLNRMLLPDGVGTGGDSHTRFPLGISFPAGSGLVAFAAAAGFMPLDMPESVLVRFRGQRRPGITLRDLVNAIPLVAQERGELSLGGNSPKNPFAGRILEIQGLEGLSVEEAFEMTNASAERSAAAATIALAPAQVAEFLTGSVALLRRMLDEGYQDAEALRRRIAAMEAWLAAPELLAAEPDAAYAVSYDIDCDAVTEPLLACPNDPDRIAPLAQVAGQPVQEVFIGSCMTRLEQFRTFGRIVGGAAQDYVAAAVWVCPPTRLEAQVLREEGLLAGLGAKGCRLEMPGCSLCMGNQARVRPGATVFSTSTRNFDNRVGTGAQVFLGSAELAAAVALLGRLPTIDEYHKTLAAAGVGQ